MTKKRFLVVSDSYPPFVNSAAVLVEDFAINLNEKGYDKKGNIVIEVNKKYYRPSEVELLIGSPKKAKKKLGWKPKISINGLVKEMIDNDYNLIKYDSKK